MLDPSALGVPDAITGPVEMGGRSPARPGWKVPRPSCVGEGAVGQTVHQTAIKRESFGCLLCQCAVVRAAVVAVGRTLRG
jgi:hypothetical protein